MRLLLKLSGEQLAGDGEKGFDLARARWIAGEIKKAQEKFAEKSVPENGSREKLELVIVAGAGNLVRGAEVANREIRRVPADNMGMLSGMINAIALAEVLNACGVEARPLSNLSCPQVMDDFTYRRALSHLAKGRVVIIGGGLGRPYFTHDSAAVNLALELDCDLVAKATKVDGVYDADPAKNPNAKKFEKLSFSEVMANENIRVMDRAALGLAAEHQKAIVVFELLREGNVAKICVGEKNVGTWIN